MKRNLTTKQLAFPKHIDNLIKIISAKRNYGDGSAVQLLTDEINKYYGQEFAITEDQIINILKKESYPSNAVELADLVTNSYVSPFGYEVTRKLKEFNQNFLFDSTNHKYKALAEVLWSTEQNLKNDFNKYFVKYFNMDKSAFKIKDQKRQLHGTERINQIRKFLVSMNRTLNTVDINFELFIPNVVLRNPYEGVLKLISQDLPAGRKIIEDLKFTMSLPKHVTDIDEKLNSSWPYIKPGKSSDQIFYEQTMELTTIFFAAFLDLAKSNYTMDILIRPVKQLQMENPLLGFIQWKIKNEYDSQFNKEHVLSQVLKIDATESLELIETQMIRIYIEFMKYTTTQEILLGDIKQRQKKISNLINRKLKEWYRELLYESTITFDESLLEIVAQKTIINGNVKYQSLRVFNAYGTEFGDLLLEMKLILEEKIPYRIAMLPKKVIVLKNLKELKVKFNSDQDVRYFDESVGLLITHSMAKIIINTVDE